MRHYHSKPRKDRGASQNSVTAILSNNCNNVVITLLGTVFSGTKQNCRTG
jgi:hypothetical protein